MRTLLKKYHPVPAILSGFFIAVICIIPGNNLPQNQYLSNLYFDKWVHLLIYLFWTYVWLCGLAENTLKKQVVSILIFTSVFAAVIEWIQDAFIRDRTAEWADWVAGTVGSVFGLWLAELSLKKNKKIHK